MSTISSSGSGSSYDDSPLIKANSVEREANARILASHKRVEQANNEATSAVSQIKDEFERQAVHESIRQQTRLEGERTKGYEQIRDVQRNQQAQLRKMRRDGERDVSQLHEYYRDKTHNSEVQGSEAVQQIQNQTNRRIAFEKASSDAEIADIRSKNEVQKVITQKNTEAQIQQLVSDNKKQYERMRTVSEEANGRIQEKFNDKIQHTLSTQGEIFNRIQSNASQQIKEIRQDTAEKLAAYRSRQSDPFYKLYTLNAKIRDDGDKYVLTAQIPEYEQKNVAVNVKGNNLVVSGYRKNEELILEGDHTKGTNSFQSFHESFPLTWPVDSKALSRHFEGDILVVQVPKKKDYVYQTPKLGKPEKVRAEPPKFPENIRTVHHERKPIDENEEPKPAPPQPGSDTLS
jgi:HSP20 family molecular chaperone IbpA